MTSPDVVGVWDVPVSGRLHRVEFEHGSTSGRRVIRVDGTEVVRRDWMFKLVGNESFLLPDQKTKCTITIRAANSFNYEYNLFVDGKSLKAYREEHGKLVKTWNFRSRSKDVRVVLDKESLEVFVDGSKVETDFNFSDEDDSSGSSMTFQVGEGLATIRTISSGNKREGIIYCLIVDNQDIPETLEVA